MWINFACDLRQVRYAWSIMAPWNHCVIFCYLMCYRTMYMNLNIKVKTMGQRYLKLCIKILTLTSSWHIGWLRGINHYRYQKGLHMETNSFQFSPKLTLWYIRINMVWKIGLIVLNVNHGFEISKTSVQVPYRTTRIPIIKICEGAAAISLIWNKQSNKSFLKIERNCKSKQLINQLAFDNSYSKGKVHVTSGV